MTIDTRVGSRTHYPALARCVAVDGTEFLDDYFGRLLLHTPADALLGDFSDLFSTHAVRCTSRCSAVRDLATDSSSSRWPGSSTRGAAARVTSRVY